MILIGISTVVILTGVIMLGFPKKYKKTKAVGGILFVTGLLGIIYSS